MKGRVGQSVVIPEGIILVTAYHFIIVTIITFIAMLLMTIVLRLLLLLLLIIMVHASRAFLPGSFRASSFNASLQQRISLLLGQLPQLFNQVVGPKADSTVLKGKMIHTCCISTSCRQSISQNNVTFMEQCTLCLKEQGSVTNSLRGVLPCSAVQACTKLVATFRRLGNSFRVYTSDICIMRGSRVEGHWARPLFCPKP